jgi:hypothetical protein
VLGLSQCRVTAAKRLPQNIGIYTAVHNGPCWPLSKRPICGCLCSLMSASAVLCAPACAASMATPGQRMLCGVLCSVASAMGMKANMLLTGRLLDVHLCGHLAASVSPLIAGLL